MSKVCDQCFVQNDTGNGFRYIIHTLELPVASLASTGRYICLFLDFSSGLV